MKESGELAKIEREFAEFVRFTERDLLQVVTGATLLAIPVGFTEEVWRIGEILPLFNVFGFLFLSLLFISLFVHYHYHKTRENLSQHRSAFFKRVLLTYLFSFIVVSVLLTLIQQAPWNVDFALALKRAIIVTFPSSMSAALVDTLK